MHLALARVDDCVSDLMLCETPRCEMNLNLILWSEVVNLQDDLSHDEMRSIQASIKSSCEGYHMHSNWDGFLWKTTMSKEDLSPQWSWHKMKTGKGGLPAWRGERREGHIFCSKSPLSIRVVDNTRPLNWKLRAYALSAIGIFHMKSVDLIAKNMLFSTIHGREFEVYKL